MLRSKIVSRVRTWGAFRPAVQLVAAFSVIACQCEQRYKAEMETGRVNRHRSDRPAGRVAGRVEILRPAGQAG